MFTTIPGLTNKLTTAMSAGKRTIEPLCIFRRWFSALYPGLYTSLN
jgi:hypothetical protein